MSIMGIVNKTLGKLLLGVGIILFLLSVPITLEILKILGSDIEQPITGVLVFFIVFGDSILAMFIGIFLIKNSELKQKLKHFEEARKRLEEPK